MPTPLPAFEFTPKRSPRMVLVLLPVSHVLLAMKTAGARATDGQIRRELLRHSLRAVGDTKVKYTDLQGEKFGGHLPRTRHRLTGVSAFNRLHEPTIDERVRLRDSLEFSETEDSEQCTARLPDGRTVTVQEVAEQTVEDAFRNAQQESGSGAFAQLRSLVDTLRAAVVAIDGKAISKDELAGRSWEQHFSVKETLLLGDVIGEMQGDEFEEEGAVPLESKSASSGT